jgi:signal transduction histidine kinase
MFGRREADMIGKNCRDLFGPELAELVEKSRRDSENVFTAEIGLAGGRIGKAVAAGIRKDTFPSDSAEEKGIGSVTLIRDITSEKEVDRMKTDFLSTVSHELRTPLTSVLGFTKIIKKKLEEAIFPELTFVDKKNERAIKRVRDNIDIILSEGDRLTALINDVLDIAKLEAGKLEWKTESFSISEVIERATAATSALFEQKRLPLIKDIAPELPEVIGDRDRIIQVAINLLSNAVKFTQKGFVTCRATMIGSEIIVSVIDTGTGINEAELQTVFEKFKQVGDTLTDKPRGTGLGLAICKQIIEHHGGRIWVESKLGRGSNFSFSLPVTVKIELEPLHAL